MIVGDVRPATAVHGLFVVFGFLIAAFFPFLALYLDGRGLSEGEIGVVIATMAVARILLNPIWGHLADTTVGRRTMLQIGALGGGVAALAMNRLDGLMLITIGMFALAGMMATTGPNIDAIALEHLGADRMSDYGRMRGWESLSYAAGCLVFGATLESSGVRWAMPIFAAASVAVFVWSFTVGRDTPRHAAKHGKLGAVGAVFREAPRFWGFLAAVFLVWTGFNAAWNFIALRITGEGGGPLLIGIGTAAGGLVEVPVMRMSSRLQRRWGLRRVYALGCTIYATGFLLWGSITNPTVLSMLTILEGMGFGLLFTTTVVIVGRLVPPSLHSTGNSVAQMVGFGIGPILGAGVGGFVFERAGPVVLYSGAAVLALGGAVVAWFALAVPELDEPRPDSTADRPVEPPPIPPEPFG